MMRDGNLELYVTPFLRYLDVCDMQIKHNMIISK